MTISHTFFLPVTPNCAQRTRATCRGKFAQVYLDPKYREWRAVAETELLKIAATEDFREVAERPVRIETDVLVPRPKTTKRAFPKGDIDNYEKGLWDAITATGRWWKDDDQIVTNSTTKRFALDNERPGYAITVTFL